MAAGFMHCIDASQFIAGASGGSAYASAASPRGNRRVKR